MANLDSDVRHVVIWRNYRSWVRTMIESSKKECPHCGWTLFQDETHFWCGNITDPCGYAETKEVSEFIEKGDKDELE